jgi:hypothetical protein
MTFTSKARKTTLAALAAITLVAAGSTLAPTQAQAGGNINAFIGGAIVGGFIAASQSGYNSYYPAPVYRSCYTRWETRYNYYGQPYSVKVRYC